MLSVVNEIPVCLLLVPWVLTRRFSLESSPLPFQNPELIRQPKKGRDFDVVFKKGSVFLHDSREDSYGGWIHNQRRTPMIE